VKKKAKKDRYGRKVPAYPPADKAVKRFEKSINMEALRLFLDSNDLPKYQILFGLMVDPAYRKYSFSSLLRKAQIPLQEIQALYSDGMRHIGLLKMMNELPQIMSDVAEDAKTTVQPCPRCDALGTIAVNEEEGRECPLCEGQRYIKKVGDRHARDLVFESAKLTGQAPNVAVQTNIHIGDAKLEQMLKRTRSIVLDKTIEAEVVSSDGKSES
jgi:hypothetical protein